MTPASYPKLVAETAAGKTDLAYWCRTSAKVCAQLGAPFDSDAIETGDPTWKAWYAANKPSFDARFDAVLREGRASVEGMARGGKLTLYRLLELRYDLGEAIRKGKRRLGVCWAHKPDELAHGAGQFGMVRGGRRDAYLVTATAPLSAVNWSTTLYLFVELGDFENEIRLKAKQPLTIQSVRLDGKEVVGMRGVGIMT